MNEAERYLKERLNEMRAQHPATSASMPSGPQRMVEIGTAWKYFWTRWTFQGRASRSEYWWMVLLLSLIGWGFQLVAAFMAAGGLETGALAIMAVSWIFNLVCMIPGICLQVRRLHDTNHSGWCWWWFLVPIIGTIYLWYLFIRRSDTTENRFGPVPNTDR